MTKRISITGQGADIFFEGLSPGSAEKRAPDPPPSTVPDGLPDSKTARRQATQTDGLPESKTAGRARSMAQELAGKISGSTRRRLRSLLRREHRVHNTFRYTREELAAVRDIVYELEVRWGSKVTRNDVMRAALNWVIEDFKERRGQSFLAQLFEEED